MMLVFPPVYLAAYAVQTPYFKANNFLPILPFSALAAAWLLTGLWRWAGDGLPFLASRYAGLVAGGAVALAGVGRYRLCLRKPRSQHGG